MQKLVSALAVLSLMNVSFAHAESDDEGTKQTSSKDDSAKERVLDEIVVTATKRPETARDLPLSIDVFRGDDLEKRGLDDLAKILKYSPGIYLQPGSTPDSNQINIRGGSSSSGDFNRPFGIFYDDIPLINPTFIGTQPELDPVDMATVEVLKGPQGTLFGGSALLGAIRYVPNDPSLDGTFGFLSYGYGKTSHSDDFNQQMTGMVNYAVNDRFAIRAAASMRDRGGVIDDTYSGEKDVDGSKVTNARAMALWKIDDRLSANFLVQYRKQDSDANVATTIDNDQGRQVNGRRRGGPDGSESDQTLTRIGVDWESNWGPTLSLTASRLSKNGHLYSSAYLQDLAGVEIVNPFDKYDDTTQDTYEARAVQSTPTQSGLALLNDWKYVVGLYYMKSDQKMHLQTLYDFNNPPDGFPLPTNILTGRVRANAVAKETALYFDATRGLTDRLELNLGGRLFEQRTPLSLGLLLTGLAAGGGAVDPEFVRTESLKESGFNPRAALTLRVTDNISAYTSIARGYRFGGINLNLYNSPLVPSLFESDSVWNYELGTRTTWLNDRLQIDVTAFHIDWNNRQTSQRTPTDPSVEYIANTGAWNIDGVEAGLRSVLPYGFDVNLNASYVNSTSNDPYINDNGILVPPGTPELTTPKWNGSAVIGYTRTYGDWDVDSSVSYAYRSATDSPLLNAPLDSFGTVDAAFSMVNSKWPMSPELSLTITNLTNSDALVAASATAPAGTPGRVFSGITVVPRTVMLNLKFRFGEN
ncbi:MAG: TonB-dependent receptor [Hyphomonas sp.]|nr:TonB-dependent receptor [Hyphomonas sp.]